MANTELSLKAKIGAVLEGAEKKLVKEEPSLKPSHQRSASARLLDRMSASLSKVLGSGKKNKPKLSQKLFYTEFMESRGVVARIHSEGNRSSPFPGGDFDYPKAVIFEGNPEEALAQKHIKFPYFPIVVDLTESGVKFPEQVLGSADQTNISKLQLVFQTGGNNQLLQPEHVLFTEEQVMKSLSTPVEEVCTVELFVYNPKIKCENARITLLSEPSEKPEAEMQTRSQSPSEPKSRSLSKSQPESKTQHELQAQKSITFKCFYKTQATFDPSPVKISGLAEDLKTEYFFSVLTRKDGKKIATYHCIVPLAEFRKINEHILQVFKKKRSFTLKKLMKQFEFLSEEQSDVKEKDKIVSFLQEPYEVLKKLLEFYPLKPVTVDKSDKPRSRSVSKGSNQSDSPKTGSSSPASPASQVREVPSLSSPSRPSKTEPLSAVPSIPRPVRKPTATDYNGFFGTPIEGGKNSAEPSHRKQPSYSKESPKLETRAIDTSGASPRQSTKSIAQALQEKSNGSQEKPKAAQEKPKLPQDMLSAVPEKPKTLQEKPKLPSEKSSPTTLLKSRPPAPTRPAPTIPKDQHTKSDANAEGITKAAIVEPSKAEIAGKGKPPSPVLLSKQPQELQKEHPKAASNITRKAKT